MPAGASGTAADVAWTQFEDPAEHAFTMQVPRGWKVVGSAYRFGPLDPRAMVDMIAPDGKRTCALAMPTCRPSPL